MAAEKAAVRARRLAAEVELRQGAYPVLKAKVEAVQAAAKVKSFEEDWREAELQEHKAAEAHRQHWTRTTRTGRGSCNTRRGLPCTTGCVQNERRAMRQQVWTMPRKTRWRRTRRWQPSAGRLRGQGQQQDRRLQQTQGGGGGRKSGGQARGAPAQLRGGLIQ